MDNYFNCYLSIKLRVIIIQIGFYDWISRRASCVRLCSIRIMLYNILLSSWDYLIWIPLVVHPNRITAPMQNLTRILYNILHTFNRDRIIKSLHIEGFKIFGEEAFRRQRLFLSLNHYVALYIYIYI